MHEKKRKRIRGRMANAVENAVNSMTDEGRGEILSDVLGSYTGTAADGEMPEQDADDL